MPTDLECAYAAGFFDGEGTITIREEDRPNCRTHILVVSIGQTSPEPLRWIQERFGGGMRGPVERGGPNHKPIYFWYAGASKAGAFLEAVHPYLINKKAQADIGLELRRLRGSQGVRPSDELVAARNKLKQELRELNHRGIAPIPLSS